MGHNVPLEGSEREPEGYSAYQGRGGTLSAADFQKVWDTPSTVKLRGKVEGMGVEGDVQQLVATSLLKALQGDGRTENAAWVRTETYALLPKADEKEKSNPSIRDIQGDASRASEIVRNADFESYQERGGEMTAEEFDAVQNQRMDQGDFGTAMRMIMGLGMGLPDNAMVTKAAAIYGALKGKNPQAENAQWLIAETYIHLNRM